MQGLDPLQHRTIPSAAGSDTGPALTTLRDTPTCEAGEFGNGRIAGVLGYTTNLHSTVGTLEASVSSSVGSGRMVAVGNSDHGSDNGIWLGFSGGKAGAGLPGTDGPAGTASVSDGQPLHLALTINGTNAQLWVDGVLAGTKAYTHLRPRHRAGRHTRHRRLRGRDRLRLDRRRGRVRISNSVRYTAAFNPPSAPFTAGGNTVARYHLNS